MTLLWEGGGAAVSSEWHAIDVQICLQYLGIVFRTVSLGLCR